MTKREVLANLTFGQRIAEDEAEALASYFVETEQWRKIVSGEADVVLCWFSVKWSAGALR